MRKIILTLMLAPMTLMAQTLTLDACREMARSNYPAVRQYRLIEQSRDFTLANAAKGWLPQVTATGGGYAFTDVVSLSAQMSAMTGDMKNHLLNASVQVSQPIYDGGAIAARKRVAQAQADVEREQLSVTLYDINDRVDQLYFGILLIDEQLRQLRLLRADLELSRKTVGSMMKGGIANQGDMEAVQVELVRVDQQESALTASRQAYLAMLSTFVGRQLAATDSLAMPPMLAAVAENRRPELDYFRSQHSLLDQQRRQLDAQIMPRLSAFGMGTYHNKVMGLMKDGMLAAGLTLSWNIAPLYTRKNDLRKISLAREQIDAQRETFLFNTRLQSQSVDGAIASLRQQIAQDDEIIRLRESIRKKSEKKVQLGTETVNEMLRNVNAVGEARQARVLHEVQLLRETYRLRNINNN